MSPWHKKIALPVLGSLAVLVGTTGAAKAYGPEGLFGGRLNPDSTVTLNNPVQPEDRPERAQSVLQHPRPDYDPVPVSMGSFELFPALEVGNSYDSNIYATAGDKVSDDIVNARPSLTAFSNWNRHALATTMYGDMNFNVDHNKEDYKTFVFETQGRYDVMAQTWLAARGGFQHLAEPRSSADNAGGSEPTKFNVYEGGFTAFRGVGKIKPTVDYDLKRLSYDDVESSTGTISQAFRTRNHHTFTGKVGYDLTANFKPYVKGSYNRRDYDHGNERSSDGYEAMIGTTADFGGITSADAFVGWMAQDYANFGPKQDNEALKFGGRLEWNVTGLTSVVLEVNRTIEETTLANFNSYRATGGSATVTHELRRNVLLEGDFSFTRNDFVGAGERQDDEIVAGPGVRWLINRYLYSDLVYSWSHRISSVDDADYTRHIASLRLGLQM